MYIKSIFIAAAMAFATFASAAPLEKRAVTVKTDGSTASITATIATTQFIAPDDVGGKANAAGAVAQVVNKVIQLIQGLIDGDLVRRPRFTQETVSAVSIQFPRRTVVMSNVGYTLTCTPEVLSKTRYKAKVGSNVSYDVLVFWSGCTFTLNGDGGFENWAYIRQASCTASGKTITC